MQHILKKTLAMFALVMFSSITLAEDVKPSATLEIDEHELGFILTGDWGSGTLNYGGEQHKFKMGGAKIGGVGATNLKVDGDVYYLNDLQDFAGVYFKAEAGITVIEGKQGAWLKNGKGVTLHLKSGSEGVALEIGLEGLEIKLKD